MGKNVRVLIYIKRVAPKCANSHCTFHQQAPTVKVGAQASFT